MTNPVPVAFHWTDVDVVDAQTGVVRTRPAMVPLRRFEDVCGRQFDLGEVYLLAPEVHASDRSRRHFFACLRDAWKNLPENIAHRYPSETHLRKAALVKAGFRNERHQVCATYKEALEVGALMKFVDEFVVTVVHPGATEGDPATLSVYTAKSQSRFAMKAPEFQASKVAVLALVAGLIGVTPEELGRQGHGDHRDDGTRNPDEALGEPQGTPAGGGPKTQGRISGQAQRARAAIAPPKTGEGP